MGVPTGGGLSNDPAGPGNTTGLSQPSTLTDDTPKNQSSITTSFRTADVPVGAQRLNRHVRFRADYGLYEYTAYVYREPR